LYHTYAAERKSSGDAKKEKQMSTSKSTNKEVTTYVKTWGNLRLYILPSVITLFIGILLFLIQSYFWAIILLLTGPCVILCTYLEISKSITKDKERGYSCSKCNGLLRQRYISWVDDDGAMCDAIDYYCCTCKEVEEVKTDANTNSECDDIKEHVKTDSPPFVSSIKYAMIITLSLIILIGIPLCGINGCLEWQKVRNDKKFPIVKGSVVERKPIIYKGIIPGVKFSIKIGNSNVIVHANTQRYLMSKVANEVNFRYSGNPNREVFLMDYEEYPLWEFIICLFGVIFITTPLLVCIKEEYFKKRNLMLLSKAQKTAST